MVVTKINNYQTIKMEIIVVEIPYNVIQILLLLMLRFKHNNIHTVRAGLTLCITHGLLT